MLVRFGWSRQFAQHGFARPPSPEEMRQAPEGTRSDRQGRNDPSLTINVIGQEATPAHRFIPPSEVLTSPASSDSTDWAVQLPPVVAQAVKLSRTLSSTVPQRFLQLACAWALMQEKKASVSHASLHSATGSTVVCISHSAGSVQPFRRDSQ